MTDFAGGCHCGAIGFVYRSALEPANWPLRACQCRFCRMHDAISASDPQGELRFTAERPELMQRYRFGLRTADFLLCRECGIYIGAVIDSDAGLFGIINTHALQDAPPDLGASQPSNYDGEDTAGRVDRRIARWTPVTGCP